MQRAWPVMAVLGCLALKIAAMTNVDPDRHYVPATAVAKEAPPAPSCNRYETISLATKDLESDIRSSIDRTSHFLAHCKDDAQVREVKLRAHVRLGETLDAMNEADQMIALDATDPAFRVTRGELHEQAGQDELAAADYRDALRLNPASTNAPLKLANVYVRQGRSCDASLVLKRAIELHPSTEARRPYVDRLSQIQCKTKPRAAKLATTTPVEPAVVMPVNLTPAHQSVMQDKVTVETSEGRTVIPFTRGQTAETNVTLNGQLRMKMIVDTGASAVSISRKMATQLGINVDSIETVQVSTAGGPRTMWTTTLAEVRVGNSVARNVRCIIGEDRDIGDEGLLGQSFLSRFKTTVDAEHGVITLGQ